MHPAQSPIYRFCDIEVDTSRGCLRKNHQEQHLRQKTFQVLVYLLEQRDRLVTKDELIARVWKDTAVTDNVLVQCVMDIRTALDDDSRNPRFVRTIPKVGYRFIGPVEVRSPDGLVNLETEETTSVELEYEEEIPDSLPAAPALPATDSHQKLLPAATPPRSLARRLAPFLTIALVSATALALALGLPQRLFRSRPAEAFLPQTAGKKPLAVMSFENQSQTKELDWLRDGLSDMLITDLSRSSKLTVLSRQQLYLHLDRIGHKQSSPIQLEEALTIARRTRANTIILGSFAKLGDKIRITAQIHDTHTGQLIRAESLTVDRPDQIFAQIDLLSLKLAADMGAPPADQDKKSSLSELMTNNLEAYRYYSLAQEEIQGLRNKDAISLLEKAIALDPQFAMAYARIGYAYGVSWGLVDQSKPYLEKAFQLSDRSTDKDRLSIAAWYAIANQDYPAAVRSFREIIHRYPMEVEAYSRLGHLLFGEEQYAEAIGVLQQGLVIDPDAQDLYNELGAVYSTLGRHDQAIEMRQRYVALAPQEANAHDSLGLAYQWAGRYREAIEDYQRALALRPDFEIARVHLGNTYFQLGRYQDAIREFREYIRVAPSAAERQRGIGTVAWVSWRQGRLDQAPKVVRGQLSQPKIGWDVYMSRLLALERGDVSAARKFKERISDELADRGMRGTARIPKFLDGYFDLQTGHATEAVALFKEALQHRPPVYHIDAYEDCLANAYLKLGQLDDAIAEYHRILRLNPNYPLAHYHLAQAYEHKGLPDRAQAEYKQFLETWNDADPDIPEVITAKRSLAR